MVAAKQKIINDPVYGFITIRHPLVFAITGHPWYQRLRRIQQMALANLVYPGAVHTRLHHSLGAYHLMCQAVNELRGKGVDISEDEETGVKAAILLHDIGHGPFSHALEQVLLPGVHHESIGLQIMKTMDAEFGGALRTAIDIFTGNHPKPFLHQLISGQLDMDRMDYLSRDSFFTGVSEGVIGYDRILKMLTVKGDELMIEEKGIYSVEKFLVSRRQMYWQVYLHKTVLAAEKMLVRTIERARSLYQTGDTGLDKAECLGLILGDHRSIDDPDTLVRFCNMDDADILHAVKCWRNHPDKVLSTLSTGLLDRKLLKCRLQSMPVREEFLEQKRAEAVAQLGIPPAEAGYFVFAGEAVNTAYQAGNELINILYKDGSVRDISSIDDPLINDALSTPVKKFYFCALA